MNLGGCDKIIQPFNDKNVIQQNIFRAYDIRGTYPDQLNADTASLIGKGFAGYLTNNLKIKNPKVVAGRDNRTHGEELQKAFINALVESGCKVTNIGLSPSPYLYFANTYGQFDGGCNVTASHNPPEYNGFKLITKNAHAVFGDEIQKIYQIIKKGDFVECEGALAHGNFLDDYFKQQYKADELFGRVIGIFALLALFVTGLGIFGMSAFLALQRTKEIGIRKVLGATTPSILRLLAWDFLVLIFISLLIAWPLTYWGIQQWLDSFARRMSLDVLLFLAPLVIIVVITTLTISSHIMKAALADPVDAIKHE